LEKFSTHTLLTNFGKVEEMTTQASTLVFGVSRMISDSQFLIVVQLRDVTWNIGRIIAEGRDDGRIRGKFQMSNKVSMSIF
jgi:hypothetical protein